MTEAERIVKKGVVTPEFLKEEVRSDFKVTSERKKIWAVLLDLLLEFDKVCKKHGLKYFLVYGTLLGAVRHKGFIPWDDDVDVGMFRADYEKLLKLAHEFKWPYFLQTNETDLECAMSYARLRNSNTTAVSKILSYQKMNHGLFLDIFPFDNVLPGESEERYLQIRDLNIDNGTYMRLTNPELNEENQKRVRDYIALKKNPQETLNEIFNLATKYNGEETGFVSNLTCNLSPFRSKIFPKVAFETLSAASIEGYTFPIPAGYDEILKISYGNYMEFPPVEKRGIDHTHYEMNADIAYSDYLVK